MGVLSDAAQKKFEELKSSKCSQKAIQAIYNLIADGSDFDCYKINAFRIAQKADISRADSLQAFLYATKLGIMDLNWDIHCPSCKGIPEYHKHLMGLEQKAHCQLCAIDWELNFEEQVEVTFTVNPDIRKIQYTDWADRDFNGQMEFLDDILTREQRDFTIGCCIFGGKTDTVSGEFEEGEYLYYLPSFLQHTGRIIVSGEKSERSQQVNLVYNAASEPDKKELHLHPGTVKFAVTAQFEGMNGFLVLPKKPVNNFVSAAFITGLQDFKDLFSGEFLRADVSFAVKSVSLMFTDIKGSTAMYERLGDSAAFARVNEHFDVMSAIIREYNGGIVKTIGDAVMAAFAVNEDAVRAAIKIQQEFRRQEQSGDLNDVQVKIGLHRGPAITVTSNRTLDYFGRTVNIAARVQSKSSENEILLSDSVYDDSVKQFLSEISCTVTPRFEELKGIESKFRVQAVTGY